MSQEDNPLMGEDPQEDPPIERTTGDLRDAAQEAIHRMNQQRKAAAGESDEETGVYPLPGNTTHDLAREAREAMMRMHTSQDRPDPDPAGALFDDNMMVRIQVGEYANTLDVDIAGDMVVGRSDTVTGYIPEIDLTPFGAYRLGISRRHAIIRRQSGSLIVKDLGSRNGTSINGDTLNANETRLIHSGDDIQFGSLTVHVTFVRREG